MGITKGTRGQSYVDTKKQGGLGARQKLIMDAFSRNKEHAYSAKELAIELFKSGLIRTPERNQTHPRLNELVLMGKLMVTGTRWDEETNRNVATYALPQV